MISRILADIPQVVKQSSGGSGNQTPKFLILSPNIQTAECRYVLKSISSVRLKQLSLYEESQVSAFKWFQHVSCGVWFREESKSKYPCLANFIRPMPPACWPENKTTHARNLGLCRGPSLVSVHVAWGFSQFSKKKKDLDYSAHQFNNWTLTFSIVIIMKYNFFTLKALLYSLIFSNKKIFNQLF